MHRKEDAYKDMLGARELGLTVNWIERDLDDGLGLTGPYDVVLQLRYVDASITREVSQLLAPGGIFLCEQHLVSDADVVGPRSREFRVAPGELESLLSGFDVLELHEGLHVDPDGESVALARIVARRGP